MAQEDFLKETCFCDFSHSSIERVAMDFKKRYPDPKELAVALFYFVRDKTYYNVGFWNKKASETLARGVGTCTNNANLLVALLRCVGIPAGYGVMKVRGRKYFGPVIIPKLSKFVGEESTHIYTYVFSGGKWIKCDPSDDELFATNIQHFNPQSQIVDWDGENNAELNLCKEHIISDRGPIANIDHVMRKKMKLYKVIPAKVANFYIEFLRQRGKEFKNQSEAEKSFSQWLKKNNFFYYVLYLLLSSFK